MKVRPYIYSLILFALAALMVFWPQRSEKKLFRSYDRSQVVRIISEQGGFSLSLQDGWVLAMAGQEWAADNKLVESILSLPEMSLNHRVGSKESWGETETIDMTFFGQGTPLELEIHAPPRWHVGDREGLLVSKKGQSEIYLVADRQSLDLLPFSGAALIDRGLFSDLRGEDIISYSLATTLEGEGAAQYNYAIELVDDRWTIRGAAGSFADLKPSSVTLLLLRLSQLSGEIVIPKEKEHPGEVRFSLVLQTKKGKIYKLAVGKQLIFNDKTYYQVTGESDSKTYLLTQESLAQVAPPLRDLIED